MKKLTTLLIVASLFFTAKLFAQVDSVFYYLDNIDSAIVSKITDNIEASPITMHGLLIVDRYQYAIGYGNKMSINKTGGWAVDGPEQGPQEENFAQVVVSPKAGTSFHVDSVNAWLACYGTHIYMHAAAYWDTDTNFFSMTNEILYDSATYDVPGVYDAGLPDIRQDADNAGTLHDTSFAIDTNIPDGGYFALRFFPWFNDNSSSTTKWFVIWDLRVYGTSGPATDVEDVNSSPRKFTLNQNYPNPFNPSTRIAFDLEKSGYTSLTIYNVLGEKIATVLSKEMSAGHHEVNFNASGLSSGVYLYRLESGNFSAMKKMMLMQ